MAEQKTLEELYDQISGLQHYVGHKIQHVKTSNWYIVVDIHYREVDMSIEFTYKSMHKITVGFSRPIGELLDGRFKLPRFDING